MFEKIKINTQLKKTLSQVEEMGREIPNVQMLPKPAQISMFLPLQWENSKQVWSSKMGSIFVPIERDKDLMTQLA